MKKPLPNLLGAVIRDYFTDHLPRLRGASPHTIHSYRDSIVLLLRFLAAQGGNAVTQLDLVDIDPPGILAFLSYLEKERKNGVPTRNIRLSAIHALFHFVASRNPEHLELAQRILGIPFKRARQRVIDYLEYDEIESILQAIDRTTTQGARDYALLATMFNTGARVQEIATCASATYNLKTVSGETFRKGQEGALLSNLAADSISVAEVLQGKKPRIAAGVTRLPQSSRCAAVTIRHSPHPWPVPATCTRLRSESAQEAAPSTQHAAQHGRRAAEIRR